MRPKSLALTALLVACVGGNAFLTSSAASTMYRPDCPSERLGGTSQREWRGESSLELSQLAGSLQNYVDDHQSTTTGVSFCLDYSGIELYSPDPQAVSADIAKLARFDPKMIVLREARELLADAPYGIGCEGLDPVAFGIELLLHSVERCPGVELDGNGGVNEDA